MAVRRQNALRQISGIIYRMKRQYGLPVIIRRRVNSVYDVETGKLSGTEQDIKVVRAPVLEGRVLKSFFYDLSFIAANKNFTYGGYVDTNTRMVIFDAKDLPKTFETSDEDQVIFEDRIYEIKEIHPAEFIKGYLYIVRSTKRTPDAT